MSNTLDADTDPHLVAAIAEVQRTFTNWRAANTKVARSSKPASLAAARRAANLAERAYREASDRRDELVQIRNARMTHGVTAPVVKLPDAELHLAVEALRDVGAIGGAVALSDGRVLVFRGGPFGSVEVMPMGSVEITVNGLQARDVV